jgi:hypothetical protein
LRADKSEFEIVLRPNHGEQHHSPCFCRRPSHAPSRSPRALCCDPVSSRLPPVHPPCPLPAPSATS